jgi:hypothetical protein
MTDTSPYASSEIVNILKAIFEQVKQQVESETPKPLDGEALKAVQAYQALVAAQQLKYPPDPPTDMEAVWISPGEIQLTWVEDTTNADRFLVERCQDQGCHNFAKVAEVAGQGRSFVDRNLPNNTLFRYRVRESNVLGSSDFSEIVEARAKTDPGQYNKTPRKGS